MKHNSVCECGVQLRSENEQLKQFQMHAHENFVPRAYVLPTPGKGVGPLQAPCGGDPEERQDAPGGGQAPQQLQLHQEEVRDALPEVAGGGGEGCPWSITTNIASRYTCTHAHIL